MNLKLGLETTNMKQNETKQKAINRMSHMTSAHFYFIFNIHNPYTGEPKISCRQSPKITCAFKSRF